MIMPCVMIIAVDHSLYRKPANQVYIAEFIEIVVYGGAGNAGICLFQCIKYLLCRHMFPGSIHNVIDFLFVFSHVIPLP